MNQSAQPLTDLAAMLEAFQEPAAFIAPDYKILSTNRAYLKHYGGSRPLTDRHCYEVSHGYNVPCDQAGESCPLKRCQNSGNRQRVLHLHDTCHGKEHVDVEMIPIRDESGEVGFYLEIMHLVKAATAQAGDGAMVGQSPVFNQMLGLIQRAAPSEISVLLLGESGTGKELVARAIHDGSVRAGRPFVTVECSGLSENLFESELFGHERGAFTGAINRKPGLVAAARGGTLFLDEIGEIPLPLQVKLLRLIETGTYRTVGGVELQHADFRLVCATHRNLKQMVEQGRFRQDLFYRISAFPIILPGLAERKGDLPLLADVLLKRIPGGDRVQLSHRALHALSRYSFPGNIRELRNILERGVLLADHAVIDLDQLPAECLDAADSVPASTTETFPFDEVIPLADMEQQYLRRINQSFGGEKRELASLLGISERTLYRKLKAL
ncbi:sigma-54 interaction domain-containing protein [Marinobacterium jannaschii]|uniref:sigma-54 interaction domain-containing protein n=1 Tax=Marinobacterium jannaschii TaxID=64970 RepID=UPI00048101D6|nr:sigma-54-dependent Fis family transcriptional regulator [Marinobacterium jannaschii]